MSVRAWDVAVVGAGPSGSLAAYELARAGASVLLIDGSRFPRAKVCGCCLNQRAWAALDESGLTARMSALRPHRYDTLHVQAWKAVAALPLPTGFSLSRERFDTALIEAAASTGAVVKLGARATLSDRQADGLWSVALREPHDRQVTIRCRLVIAATGLGSPFALPHLGGERVQPRSRLGACASLPDGIDVPWSDRAINMTVSDAGYVGAVRLEDGRWNLAAALDADAVLSARAIEPVVGEILAGGAGIERRAVAGAAWRGTPALSRRPRRVAAPGLLVVGDAAGYAEPFTGEGMACALQGARALVPLALRGIDRWEPELAAEWTRTLRDSVQRRLALATATAWSLRWPFVATRVTSLLSVWPELAAVPIALANQPTRGLRVSEMR